MMKKKIISFLSLISIILSVKASTPNIVVAIIDTGIDTTNTYINNSFLKDEAGHIKGWNFLGDSNNTFNPISIGKESFRIMQSLHSKYSLKDSSSMMNPQELQEFDKYIFFRKVSGIDTYILFADFQKYNYKAFQYMDSVIISQKWPRTMKIAELKNIDYSMIPDSMEEPLNQVMSESAKFYYSGKTTWDLAYKAIEDEYLLSEERLSTLGDPKSNPRFNIGDNPHDFNALSYGNSNIMAEPFEHSTSIASILSSIHPEVKGLNSQLKIMPIRVVPAGEAFDKDLYAAIRYAVENGANIIVIPQAKEYTSYDIKLTEALSYANIHNVLIVLAAGDNGRNIAMEQAVPNCIVNGKKLNNVIRVGALDKNGEKLAKSNYGSAVDVYFPGEEVKVTDAEGTITFITGTDASSGIVAGIASVIIEESPKISASEIVKLIIDISEDLSNFPEIIESYRK